MNYKILIPGILLLIALSACNQGTTPSTNADQAKPTYELIDGYVWEDSDGDGVFSQTEVGISNYGVAIITFDAEGKQQEFDEDLDVIETDEFGYFEFERQIGTVFRLDFSPTNGHTVRDSYQGFTERDVGSEATDSDVDEKGLTDIYTLSEGFFPTLSAGLLPAEAPDSDTSVSIDDPADDCVVPGDEVKHSCAGDITTCAVRIGPGTIEFVCGLRDLPEYSELDFYLTLNLDGDPATGNSEGQALGVDAALYLNGLENRIQINRFDLTGNYLRGDVLPEDVATPIYGSGDDPSLGIAITSPTDDLQQLFDQNPLFNFRVVTYTPGGGQFVDDTAVFPDSLSIPSTTWR